MRRCRLTAVCTASLLIVPFDGRGAEPSPIPIPKEGEGYQITRSDSSRAAPSGYEGRTDLSSLTAVGNTAATAGKRVVVRFTLGNEIKICPTADGQSQGQGEFTITVDSTNAQGGSTSTTHIDMRATATYTGKVGVDAWLDGPVDADIDFTYKQTGTIRDAGGAIATMAGSDIQQRVRIQFGVARDLTPPALGAFSGGDPTAGRYGTAIGVGMALSYWAGVFYSVAQTRWRQPGMCARIDFDPPSQSRQPALGTDTLVKALVKTKGGEASEAAFSQARVRGGAGTVLPTAGPSGPNAPIVFTYRAPDKAVPNAGFAVMATSRAGIAEEEWKTGLGTGWSGQISCTRANADSATSDLQVRHHSQATRIVIDVTDGVATANGFAEIDSAVRSLHNVFRGGSVVKEFDYGNSTRGSFSDSAAGTVTVNITEATGRYSVTMDHASFKDGTQHTSSCMRERCTETDAPLPIASCFGPGPTGRTDDPNRISGALDLAQPPIAGVSRGAGTWTVTWNLSRRGTTR